MTDGSGCTANASTSVNTSGGATVSTSATDENCGNADGSATATVTGGTPPYSYLWDDPAAQSNATSTGLGAGSYTVAVTDASGCASSSTVTVGGSSGPSTTASVTGSSCGNTDGTATVVATGGTSPYTYLWDNGGSQTTATANGLGAGFYSVLVTDASGCTSSESVSLSDIGAPALTTACNDIACNGDGDGSILVSASGGTTPYNYQWNDPSFQTSSAATSLDGGTYAVTVTDAVGCKAITSAVVDEPATLIAQTSTTTTTTGNCTGSATANVLGGNPPYTYSWNDPLFQATALATGLCEGAFSVVIIDANGCTITENVTVTNTVGIGEIENNLSYSIYPNPSSGDVFVDLQLENDADVEISVYNTIGELMSFDKLTHISDYKYILNCSQYAGGIYYVHLRTDEEMFVNKITIVK